MGLILDSSVVIAAERRGDTVEKLIGQVVAAAGDQDAALSSVGLTELVHGIYRAQTPEMRLRRESFIYELFRDLTVYPYTKETAMLAGKIDGEQQAKGVTVSLRRPADRGHRALPWLLCSDGQSPPLPAHPGPRNPPALACKST